MANQKINYGIDLGTTNSAIAHVVNGEVKILKSNDSQMDTTPSVVHFNKAGSMFIGIKAYNQITNDIRKILLKIQNEQESHELNTFFEFKRTMGTDKKYKCSNINREFTSEELSAEILKKLKSYVTNEKINAAVITVPAKFRQNQLDATQKAAELAGLEYCELLQEPIAASIAYGLDTKIKQGFWLVFDFGGGTFDSALMKVDEGIMKVLDTEGDNHLGGKNLDYAIVDHLFIPKLMKNFEIDNILFDEKRRNILRDSLKRTAEEIKIELSLKDSVEVYLDDFGYDDLGSELILNYKLSLSDFEDVVRPIFQRAIDISNNLLKRNNVNPAELNSLVLVGGPTLSNTLREMIKDQLSSNLSLSIDPMTVVAKGAALYASTKNIPEDSIISNTEKVQLTIKYPETTVEDEVIVGIKIKKNKTEDLHGKLNIEILRTDKAWSSGKIEFDENSQIVSLPLVNQKANTFNINLFDSKGNYIQCEPNEFTILQGIKIAEATLPHNIGIDLFDISTGKIGVYTLRGLEKNTPLPTKGKGIFKTQKDIRPGNPNDYLKIEIYEIGHEEDGSRKMLNELIGIITIDGEDIPQFLPAGSDVEITIEIDSSRRIKFSAYFPYFDDYIELKVPEQRQKEFNADDLFSEIEIAKTVLGKIENEEKIVDREEIKKLKEELESLDVLLKNGKGDYNTKTEVQERLRNVLKKMDVIIDINEWPKTEEELDWIFNRAKQNSKRYGNKESENSLKQYSNNIELVKKQENVKLGKELINELRSFNFNLIKDDIGFWINYIKMFNSNFDNYKWLNSEKARTLIDEANEMISVNPSKSKIEQIVRELYGLLPEQEKQAIIENDETTLLK